MRKSAWITTALLYGFVLTAQIPTASLVGHWPFNGNANDYSGNSNNGTVNGATLTADRFGNLNSAYSFDGINDQIMMNYSPSIDMSNTTDFSISFWVKTYSNPTADANMISNNTYGQQSGYGFFSNGTNSGYCTTSGQLSFYVGAGVSGDACANNGIAGGSYLNTWIHITGVYNSTLNQAKLYVNGILQNDIGSRNGTSSSSANLCFGSHPTNILYFKGALDDIRIYKTQLSQNDVNAIFNECFASVAPANVTPPANQQICPGKTATLSALGTGTIGWYSSATSTLALASGSAFVTPTLATGQYTYYAQDLSCSGYTGTPSRAAIYVTVSNGPSMSVNSGAICAGQSFTIVPSGAANYTFSGNGSSVVSPLATTQYTVSGINSSNCLVSAVSQVQVHPLPVLAISGNNQVCAGSSINLLATGNGLTYIWSTGAVTNLVSLTPSATSVYTVSGTDANGCIGSVTKTIIVNPLPIITVAMSNPPLVCFGSTIVLNATGALSYQWSGGVTNNVPFIPPASGNYTVTGTDANACQNSAVVNIVVQPLPVVTVSNSKGSICPGEQVILAAAGAVTFNWSNGNSGQQIIVTPTTTTSYTVTGTDSEGCKSSAMIVQHVDACLGISRLAEGNMQLAVYPNPSTGEFIIETSVTTEVTVADLLGQILMKKTLSPGKNKMELNGSREGIYFLWCEQAGATRTIKLIKE